MRNFMKRILIVLTACLLCASCAKEVLVTSGKVIFETEVESAAGSLDVLVSTDGVWNASSLVPWITVEGDWHKGSHVITLNYGSNRSMEGDIRHDRSGKVIVRSFDGGQCDTLIINQRGMLR